MTIKNNDSNLDQNSNEIVTVIVCMESDRDQI